MKETGFNSILSLGGGAPVRRGARLAIILGCSALYIPWQSSAALAQTTEQVDHNIIIVTAQRRAEALEDVPMTVNYLDANTLANAGATSVRDLSNVTSGFTLGQGGSVPQPAIRGVTTLINGAYENNVAVYIDGLYQTVPAAISIDLPNISNVQILKGPQGTLYGRNATGGAVLIETVSPGREWQGKAEATYASYNDRRLGGYVAGPLSDVFGFSIAGYVRRTDGYFGKLSRTEHNVTDGRAYGLEQDTIRAKLLVNVSEDIRATIGYSFTRTEDPRGIHFTPNENAPASYNLPGGRFNGQLLLPTKLGQAAFDFNPTVQVKQHEGFLKLQFDTEIGQIQSITGYQDTVTDTAYDFDGSYLPAFFSTTDNIEDSTFQQTLDYNIDIIDGLHLVVGAQYFKIKTDYGGPNRTLYGYVFQGITDYIYDGTEIPLSTYIIDNDNWFHRRKEALSVYADATIDLTDKLSLNIGARYSVEDQHVWVTRYGRGGTGVGPIVTSPELGAEKTSSYAKITPRASLRYEIDPATSVYASFSTGFKSGEWNSIFPQNNPAAWFDVQPESIKAFEVGLKTVKNWLRFDVAGFYYDYTDLQVSTTTYIPGFGTQVVLQNAPSAKIYGAEANFDAKVTDRFNVRGGGTWLHARYGDGFIFTGVSVNPNGNGVFTHADTIKNRPNMNASQDLSGMQMARSPDFSAYLGADYLIPMGEGGVRFAGNLKYTDSYVVTNPSIWGGDATYNPATPEIPVDNDKQLQGTPYAEYSGKQRFREDAYVLLNASITYTDPSGHFSARLWANNLTDHRYRMHYSGTGTFGTYSPMAEPRTIGMTVGYKY